MCFIKNSHCVANMNNMDNMDNMDNIDMMYWMNWDFADDNVVLMVWYAKFADEDRLSFFHKIF